MSRLRAVKKERLLLTAALDTLPVQRRYIYVFTCLAGLTAIQVMHLALNDMRLNLWLSLALVSGFVYSYFLEERWRGPTYYLVSALAVGVSLIYFLKINGDSAMVGAYLGILLGILLVLQAFKAFAPNDHRFILMMCVVFLMYSSAACFDLKYMLAMPVLLIFAACSMYVDSQVEVAVRVSQTTGAPIAVQLEFARSFWPVLSRAIGGTIGLSIVAYLLAPHGMRQDRPLQVTSAPRLSQSDMEEAESRSQQARMGGPQSDSAYTGIGDEFDLAGSSRLTGDSTPILQVKSHRNGYLRAQVYDVYTGSGWVQSKEMKQALEEPIPVSTRAESIMLDAAGAGDTNAGAGRVMLPLRDFPSLEVFQRLQKRATISLSAGNLFSQDQGLEPEVEVIRQEVRLLEPQPPFYFASYQPAVLLNIATTRGEHQIDSPYVDPASAVRPQGLEHWHPRGFAYTVESIAVNAGKKELERVVLPGPRGIAEHYTQLFQEDSELPSAQELKRLGVDRRSIRPVSRRLRNQAQTIASAGRHLQREGQASTWDKVVAIRDYLTNSDEFSYDREYSSPPAQVEVTDYFINHQRSGYCRQYASAMAVLCRLNGIPARVVSGFAPGSRSLIDNAFVYRNSNAHAWVEVYFDGYGWILFDPTPTSQTPFDTPKPLQYLQGAVDFLQELFVLDPAGTQQSIAAALKEFVAFVRAHLGVSSAVAAVLLLLAAAAVVLKRLPRRGRRARLVPANQVIASWLEALTELDRAGVRGGPGMTAREISLAAGGTVPGAAIPLSKLLPLYESAAYSPRPPDADAMATAAACGREVRQAVLEELARRKAARRG